MKNSNLKIALVLGFALTIGTSAIAEEAGYDTPLFETAPKEKPVAKKGVKNVVAPIANKLTKEEKEEIEKAMDWIMQLISEKSEYRDEMNRHKATFEKRDCAKTLEAKKDPSKDDATKVCLQLSQQIQNLDAKLQAKDHEFHSNVTFVPSRKREEIVGAKRIESSQAKPASKGATSTGTSLSESDKPPPFRPASQAITEQ